MHTGGESKINLSKQLSGENSSKKEGNRDEYGTGPEAKSATKPARPLTNSKVTVWMYT